MSLDVPLCTSNTKMKSRHRISNRVSALELAKKTGSRNSDLALTRDASVLSSRNGVLPDDSCPADLMDKDITSRSALTSGRRSKRPSHPAKQSQTSTRTSAIRDTMPFVQRWAGLTRTASNWDDLRRDRELWVEDGECYVHLYAQGASRRGPSFRIPYRALRQKKCGAMLNFCHAQVTSAEGAYLQQLSELSSSFNVTKHQSSIVELFVPAPEGASREDSFKWHITTRNFFAFVLGKPLVGYHMGQAFVDLQERMQLFRSGQPNTNHQDFLEYAECQGYRDLVEVTDYALANLFYAEHFKLRDVWVDAFAHCVGMSDSLACSPEYQVNSRLTKALIMRSRLDVDVHLGQVSTALSNFLEEDMSSAYLGLTAVTRSQLIRFRRFLHNFYTEKFGFWPPPKEVSFPKALYKSMCYDFQSLYDYLVDSESTTDISSQKPASGGICVLQNVVNFDQRHNFIAQPHPLPLLPRDASLTEKTESQNALRQLATTAQHNKAHRIQSLSVALALGTNRQNEDVTCSKIVRRYMHFENMCAQQASSHREQGIATADTRKVRWLLIYGMLQYLVSALRAPMEVRDAETPEYPLCCFMTEKSSWSDNSMVSTPTPIVSPNATRASDSCFPDSAANTPIEPDCQREDYFGPGSLSRRGSVELPAPLKTSSAIQSSSIRSLAAISLPRRNSHRNSISNKPSSHHEIMVQGYGNGLKEATSEATSITIAHRECAPESKQFSLSDFPDAAGPQTPRLRSTTPTTLRHNPPATSGTSHHARQRTPLLHMFQLDAFNQQTSPDENRSESPNSVTSQIWSDAASATSSKTSAGGCNLEYGCSTAEQSGLLGGLKSLENIPISVVLPESSPRCVNSSISMPSTGFSFGFEDETPKLFNATNASPTIITNDAAIGIALSIPPSPTIRPRFSVPDDLSPAATEISSCIPDFSAPSPVVRPATISTIRRKRSSLGALPSFSSQPTGRSTSSQKVKNRLSSQSFVSSMSYSTTKSARKSAPKQEVSMGTRVRTFLRTYPGF